MIQWSDAAWIQDSIGQNRADKRQEHQNSPSLLLQGPKAGVQEAKKKTYFCGKIHGPTAALTKLNCSGASFKTCILPQCWG